MGLLEGESLSRIKGETDRTGVEGQDNYAVVALSRGGGAGRNKLALY